MANINLQYKTYIKYIVLHLFFGALVFAVPFLTKIYSLLIVVFGLYIITKTKNKNHEALFLVAYTTGIEVLLRMTSGTHIFEYGKYVTILFLILGIYYKGFSVYKSIPFLIYILLLIPSIFIGMYSLTEDVTLRKAISFNFSGPLCLFFSAIYCFHTKINFSKLLQLLQYIQYPLLSMLVYIILYVPKQTSIFQGTESNLEASGGFGPNQVSTVLGLGLFISFVLLLFTKNKSYQIIQFILVLIFAYRNLLTFSRGGLLAGVLMIIVLLIYLFYISNSSAKYKIGILSMLFAVFGVATFFYSSQVTGGMLFNRYAGKDALGREKSSKFSGREDIFEAEMNLFFENPFFGVGLGKSKQAKADQLGLEIATHNEISRLFAEHGLLGLIAFAILFFTPILYYFQNKQNIFLFSFFLFWLFTINHAAMRIAAPGIIYGLSLLNIKLIDED